MNARREFLLALFHRLEEQGVPYCVGRNYDRIYDDASSDVDLMVEPADLDRLKHCLDKAAEASAHILVLHARYVNFSYVYWHSTEGFFRLDIETEVRWRVFPVLSAKAVLGLRRKHEEFYIPHPRHESVILFAAAVWRGFISERYQAQLVRLYNQFSNPEELRRTLRATFGTVGDSLADCQSQLPQNSASRDLLRSAKRSLIAQAVKAGPGRSALLHYLAIDLERSRARVQQPVGISLLYASSALPPPDVTHTFEQLELLYPRAKTTVREFKFPHARRGLPLQLERLRTLLKGGLYVHSYQLSNEADLYGVFVAQTLSAYSSREFLCVENSRNEIILAHIGSGFMTEYQSRLQEALKREEIIQFIANVLEQDRNSRQRPTLRGMFVVLLGLDGSGKTTVARKLCRLLSNSERFRKVRYFHWRPNLLKVLFPLPSPGNLPRKSPQKPNVLRCFGSALRLLKNLVFTRLAWRFRIQGLLNDQSLILMDRYYYNYYLDPVSVRYYGPRWFLDQVRSAFPKPDLVVVLKANTATLLARKQELSEEEIKRQSAVLEQLDLDAPESLVLDATLPASEIALTIMKKLAPLTSPDRVQETQKASNMKASSRDIT